MILMENDQIKQIDALFHARSIAAFGVSAKGGKLGNLLLQGYIDLNFDGEIIPIHPTASEIMGMKAYPNLTAYGKQVDLAIIALHPDKVFDAVKDCVKVGIKGIIIFSSGFGERDSRGNLLQNEIVTYAQEHGARIIGPNCMGLYSPSSKMSIFPGLPDIPGSVAFLSQSGSLAVQVVAAAYLRGIKISKAISFGNGADLDLTDFLAYLGWDPETKVITCYMEGVKNGKRFLQVAREVSKRKPILIWKVGETPGGKQAASSHTGSIGGDANLWDRLFEQAGIIRLSNVQELLSYTGAFINPFLPKGNRIAIISGPGGPAVSAADACEKVGLKLASLSEKTKQAVKTIIPEYGTSVQNPVDLSLAVAFEPSLNFKAPEIVGRDPNVDSLLVNVSVLQQSIVKGLIKTQEKIQKPIAIVVTFDPTSSMPGGERIKNLFQPIRPRRVPDALEAFYKHGISLHLTEQSAANTLIALWKYHKFLQKNL